jgi:hypothetical protein
VEFESPHSTAVSPPGFCPRRGASPGTGLTLRASWEPSPPEIGRHPRAHPTLVLSATPNLYRQQDFTSPDVTLTFHIALLRFGYAEERKAPGVALVGGAATGAWAMAVWRECAGRVR